MARAISLSRGKMVLTPCEQVLAACENLFRGDRPIEGTSSAEEVETGFLNVFHSISSHELYEYMCKLTSDE